MKVKEYFDVRAPLYVRGWDGPFDLAAVWSTVVPLADDWVAAFMEMSDATEVGPRSWWCEPLDGDLTLCVRSWALVDKSRITSGVPA